MYSQTDAARRRPTFSVNCCCAI